MGWLMGRAVRPLRNQSVAVRAGWLVGVGRGSRGAVQPTRLHPVINSSQPQTNSNHGPNHPPPDPIRPQPTNRSKPKQVNWASRRVDWDAEARPPWLPPAYPWSAELLLSKRATVEVVYGKVGFECFVWEGWRGVVFGEVLSSPRCRKRP
jgi:hypothetical protein